MSDDNKADLRNFLDAFFEISLICDSFSKDNEFEKGNFDLLWNEDYENERTIFEGYKDFKLDNAKDDIYNTTKLEK